MTKGKVPSVKSAERVLDLLELLSTVSSDPDGLTMEEMIDHLNIPRSSFYSLTRMLVHRGYIYKPVEGRYRLGVKAFEIGSSYLSNVDVVEMGRPVIRELNRLTKETVNMTMFDRERLEVIVIARETGQNSLRFVSSLGSHLPAHQTASGKLFLSEYPDRKIEQWYSSRMEETEWRLLIDELQHIRDRGYAENNQQTYNGVFILAVPIYNDSDKMISALNIGVPVHQVDRIGSEKYLALLKPASTLISYLVGCSIDPLVKEATDLQRFWDTSS